ncbi:chromatin remodelling complex ATPase chain ISW1 [Pyrenophora tritici-repentis]|nr:chromatin remodelling complex ATPase chain ISW1 [Pyrenophora tritici-repentis]KAI1527391.1 HepA Superfamily II DNA RNA helicase SNF2 family [Pyrenophora tritici-repentis]KAI1566165.1 HepA Superfamily II DNA RNA helicase SNF2 family [Pyrenophora tritici-repentis]KAI1580207.1 HepA Superfamily II DNA RNA helicase SNF2 family [Pyrenophora tritici-repentis]
MWTSNARNVSEVTDERDGLKRLSEAHLVSKDTRDTIFVQRDEPVETSNLVVAHCAALDEAWRLAEDGLVVSAMLLLPHQLGVFLLFSLAPTLGSSTTFAHLACF